MEKKEPLTFFDEICSKLNIDSVVMKSAHQQFSEVAKNTILEGDAKHWIACALFTACAKTKVPTVVVSDSSIPIQGNGVSLVKLINECNLNIYSFFEKIEIWFKVSSVPNNIQQKVDVLKRNFQLSQLIYKDYSNMFCKLFKCSENGTPEEPKTTKSRKKLSNVPYTSQKLFEMCWTLFVCVKGNSPTEKAHDLVTSVNLLLCCIDLMFTNVVHDDRRDLINPSFPGLPKNFFLPSFDITKEPVISIIDKLSDDTITKMKNTHWELIIRRFLTDKNFLGDYNSILTIENFEQNFKKFNDLYETYILSCGQFDERVFLSHPEIGSKFFGKQLSVQSSSSLIPQTPLSGQDLYSQSGGNKLSPISSYKHNVQKLQALYSNNQCLPQNSLKILLCSFSDTILNDLNERLQKMKEIFCTKMMLNGQDRFHIAEALYYRLLENIIHSELKTHGRFDLFINDDVFNETLIVLCLEIVLFAFSLHKKLTTLLECFNLEAFHFYKLIEVTIRNNKDYFTNDIIKHLKAVEEQCLDSLSWVSGSLLWEKIKEHNGKLPSNQDVVTTASQSSPNNSQSPKSLKLFFRKFYQLAHLRLKDLCKNLQFTNNTDLLRKIWTLFEFAICEHTVLMKDRHLDQILMCCVYVLCKIRPNENHHTFADIMKFYRSQPQADSHIYRSVFIEYVNSDKTNEKQDQRNARTAAEPEVVSGRNTVYGTESRGDIIYFYNKIFVPKMQQFAMRFSTSSQNNLLLSPLPQSRPLISPRKISPYHDVYVQPLTKQSILLSPSHTLTFTIEQSPSKDLQKINSLINQGRKASVAKRFNMDCDNDYSPPTKVTKDSRLKHLISDREEATN